MNHIALHILQPFPATCLNRDDVGAPKNLIFGGVSRARVSSQCWKRHIRLEARKLLPGIFAGERTRRASDDLSAALGRLGLGPDEAKSTALAVCRRFLSDKEPAKPKAKAKKPKEVPTPAEETAEAVEESDGQTTTLLYFSPGEIEAMAHAIAAAREARRELQAACTSRSVEYLCKECVKLGLPETEIPSAESICASLLAQNQPPKAKKNAKKKENQGGPSSLEPTATEEGDETFHAQESFPQKDLHCLAEAILDAHRKGEDRQKAAAAAVEEFKYEEFHVLPIEVAIAEASASARQFTRKDAADIAIFGRMVANDPTLNIEGAGLFAHAFSTHACDNDLDFWTAVDDDPSVRGYANSNHAEFNSACYYRYVALNLDLLFFQKSETGELTSNLRGLMKPEDVEARRNIVRAFLRAVLLAVPTAKQNSFNGHALPEFALGVVSSGQPFQLANAFEAPVQPRGEGWLQPSVKKLEDHFTRLKIIFGLQPLLKEEVRLSEVTPLDTFIEKLVAHVH